MAKLSNTDGFHIHGWMVNELHLCGGDLLAFALVHQFSKSDAGIYKGNTSYLSSWTGWTDKTSRSHLSRLVKMGLLEEVRGRESNSPFCYYKLASGFYEKHPVIFTESPGKNIPDHPVKISESTPQKLPGEYNNKNRKENNTTPIIPSIEQVTEHARQKGFADPEGFASYYVEYNDNRGWIAANGKPIIGWKNNINNNWMPRFKSQVFATEGNKTYKPKFNYQ